MSYKQQPVSTCTIRSGKDTRSPNPHCKLHLNFHWLHYKKIQRKECRTKEKDKRKKNTVRTKI